MKSRISGTRDGQDWPDWEVIDLPDTEAVDLLNAGLAQVPGDEGAPVTRPAPKATKRPESQRRSRCPCLTFDLPSPRRLVGLRNRTPSAAHPRCCRAAVARVIDFRHSSVGTYTCTATSAGSVVLPHVNVSAVTSPAGDRESRDEHRQRFV